METIQIQYLDDTIEKLAYIDGKSDWIDLRSAVDVELKAGEFKLIHLGIAMKLPEGYEAHVVPRSSTYKNFGIIQTNHCGIIDSSYCGPNDYWYMPAYALRDTVIHKMTGSASSVLKRTSQSLYLMKSMSCLVLTVVASEAQAKTKDCYIAKCSIQSKKTSDNCRRFLLRYDHQI